MFPSSAYPVAALLLLTACASDTTTSTPAAPFPILSEVLLQPVNLAVPDSSAVIRFRQTRQDAGRVRSGRAVRLTYGFSNPGPVPLTIRAVYPSCSCTRVDYPRTSIAPGQEGALTLTLRTDDLRGQQQQSVVVLANTAPAQTTLYLSALVTP